MGNWGTVPSPLLYLGSLVQSAFLETGLKTERVSKQPVRFQVAYTNNNTFCNLLSGLTPAEVWMDHLTGESAQPVRYKDKTVLMAPAVDENDALLE